MPRKPKVINFEAENCERMEQLRSMIGQQVPLSSAYTRGVRPVLIAKNERKRLLYDSLLLQAQRRVELDDVQRELQELRCHHAVEP